MAAPFFSQRFLFSREEMRKGSNLSVLIVMVLLVLPCKSQDIPEMDSLLRLSVCEPFANQPQACRGVMVGAWSSVWTVPAFGLTQEYWVAQLNAPSPGGLGLPVIDLVQLYPRDCALQYLKLICPTLLRPCSVPDPSSEILYPAIPHPVCASVCEVWFSTVFLRSLCIFIHSFLFVCRNSILLVLHFSKPMEPLRSIVR